jgi:hypothetical protein
MFFIIQNPNRFYSFIWVNILAVPRAMFNGEIISNREPREIHERFSTQKLCREFKYAEGVKEISQGL